MNILRVAACQYEPQVGDLEGNRRLAVEWAEKAATQGARLVVLPELASSGYVFESQDEADAAAQSADDGAYVNALVELAQTHDLTVVSGLAERAKDCLYNSAVVIDATGVLATYRKVHLFYNEQSWFEHGDSTFVVETSWGKLGVLICYDLWFPEVARSMALAGADVIAVPTNWVASFKPTVYDQSGLCQGDYVAMATAAQNGVAMVCADRIGIERDVHFLGASIVVAPDGWPLAGPASKDGVELLVADIDLDAVAQARQRTPRNHLLDDRRPDSYNAVVVSSQQHAAPPTPH